MTRGMNTLEPTAAKRPDASEDPFGGGTDLPRNEFVFEDLPSSRERVERIRCTIADRFGGDRVAADVISFPVGARFEVRWV